MDLEIHGISWMLAEYKKIVPLIFYYYFSFYNNTA